MPPLHTKKMMQLLEPKKVMQPLGKKKNNSNTWDQKNHATSSEKKSRYLSKQNKKSCNPLGQKIIQPLGTNKNHTTSQKKKKSHNHSGQKNNPNRSKQLQQNQIWSNIVQYGPICKKKHNNYHELNRMAFKSRFSWVQLSKSYQLKGIAR